MVVFSSVELVTDFVSDLFVFGVKIEGATIIRSVLLVVIAFLSYYFTPRQFYKNNNFSWEPLKEIAKIFITIFITAEPVIRILQEGENGALSFIINLVNNENGPVPHLYFWCTGILSSFLDNAPTYMVFFNTAGGDANILSTALSQTLKALSAGAVFMGSLTYIGNAPNFLIKATAQAQGIAMPSFFRYTLIVSCILMPLFIIETFLFFI